MFCTKTLLNFHSVIHEREAGNSKDKTLLETAVVFCVGVVIGRGLVTL